MDSRQIFKAAFISRCLEEGHLTPDEIRGVAEQQIKQAQLAPIVAGGASSALSSGAMGLGKGLMSGMFDLGVPLLLAGPPVIGGALGALAAKATDVSDLDPAEAKNQELIDEYNRQRSRIARQHFVARQ